MKRRILPLLFALMLSIFALASCDMGETPPTPPPSDETSEGLEFTLKEDGTYAVSAGTLLNEKEIEIPADYNGKSVSEIAERGFQQTAVASITIPSSVKSIGASAFRGCENLTSISIPNSVESIGAHAFYNCKGLATVSFSQRLKSIGDYAFYNCSGISAIALPEKLEAIGEGAFFNCTALTDATIPAGVTEIGISAFKGCDKIVSLSVPFVGDNAENGFIGYIFGATSAENNVHFVPSVLTTVSVTNCTAIAKNAFKGCGTITSISLPANLSSVGASAFEGCTAIEKLYIEDLADWCAIDFASADANPLSQGADLYVGGKAASVITIPDSVSAIKPYTFYNCTSIQVLTVKNGVKEIGTSAFEGCEKLVSVNLADSVTRIGFSAFKNCDSMEEITLPFIGAELGGTANTHFGYIFGGKTRDDNELTVPETLRIVTVTSATSIGFSAFYGCRTIHSITLPAGLKTIENAAFSVCTKLTAIEIPKTVTAIGESAFSYCTSLVRADIPDSVVTVGNFCFYECTELSTVTLGKSLTAVSNDMFKGCVKLFSVSFAPTNAITAIGHQAFLDCQSLATIEIPKGVTLIDSYAFAGCTSLTSIVIPDSVETVKDAVFNSCYALARISVGNGIRAFGTSVFDGTKISFTDYNGCYYIGNETNPYVVVMGYTSRHTKNLAVHSDTKAIAKKAFVSSQMRTISLPEGLMGIGAGAFQACVSLQRITIPSKITVIDDTTFDLCRSLSSVSLPSGLTYIGRFAFRDCFNLTTFTVPDAVTLIEGGAFANCTKLATLVLGAGIKEIKEEAFADAGLPLDPDAEKSPKLISAVYYKGTASDFDRITIGAANNDSFLTAPRYYYSETQPATAGSYWHYDASGNIEIWEN